MANQRVHRRLAAILAADVTGYSRLVEADEAGTIVRLQNLLTKTITPLVAEHEGRMVKLMGDGLLAEFASAVDAVSCACAIQQAMKQANAESAATKQIEFRVGINLGDVVVEGDDIHGDGVNVAARLEALCIPGEVYISASVFDQVSGKFDATFDDLGEKALKNISRAVRVYRVRPESTKYGNFPAPPTGKPPRHQRPGIAVLPFTNMSGDPEQEYFADGVVDEIITQLSRFSDLIVIARNSTFTYKGRAVKVQDIGRELGVTHILEGSVRKAGNRVRISVQLVDTEDGRHIWAERYDREYADIFELQDELTEAIIGILPGRVEMSAADRLRRKPPGDMAAYDLVLAGKIHHDRITRDDNIEALRLLSKATELEPDFAAAWAWRACTLGQALAIGYRDDPETVYRQAVESVQNALKLDQNDVNCHRLLCEVNMEEHRLDAAKRHHEIAYRLNPNDVLIVAQRGELMTWLGNFDEGVTWIEKAIRLDPFAARKRAHLLGRALHGAQHYGAAL